MDDNKKKLYDALVAKGLDLGDYNLYQQKIQDPTNREKLRQAAISNGFDVGDAKTFDSALGVTGEPQPKQPGFKDYYQAPYESLANKLPDIPIVKTVARGIGKVLDVPMAIPNMISQGAGEAYRGLKTAPNLATGAAEVGKGVGTAALGAAGMYSLPMYAALLALKGVNEASPAVGSAVSGAMNPITSMANPQDRLGKGVAGMGDLALQALMINRANSTPDALYTKPPGESAPSVANRLYQKSLRPTGTNIQQTSKVGTGIQESIIPGSTTFGTQKLNNIVSDLNSKVDGIVKSSDFVDTQNTLNHVDALTQKVRQRSIAPDNAQAEIYKVVSDYIDQHPDRINAKDAQELKKGIYERNKAAYETQQKTGKLPPLDTKTEMTIARGIKDELNNLYPELTSLNAREGALLKMQKDLETSVRVELNKPLLPHSILAALDPRWWLARLISDNPKLKGSIAIAIDRASRVPRPKPVMIPQQEQQQ